MARIFITGSSDGLGSIVAQRLVARGHSVVLHARNPVRAEDATKACSGAETVLTGDLSSIEETKKLADDDYSALLFGAPYSDTADGIPPLAAVNTLAPYILTCLIARLKRMVFVSSDMHQSGDGSLEDILWQQRGEKGYDPIKAYRASKVLNVMLAKAFARRWPEGKSNSLDPGWVPTKMGGTNASGDMEAAVATYVMLAEGEEDNAQRSGIYYNPGPTEGRAQASTDDEKTAQERLLQICADFTGMKQPI
ncbi:hypothetical protein PMIN06_000163 [Paraphaeosphaeria minitans]